MQLQRWDLSEVQVLCFEAECRLFWVMYTINREIYAHSTHDLNHTVFSHYVVYDHLVLLSGMNLIMMQFLGVICEVKLLEYNAARNF